MTSPSGSNVPDRFIRLDGSRGHHVEVTRRLRSTGGSCSDRRVTRILEISKTRPSEIVHSDPSILGGTPVFVGTRVPIQSLFDYLEGGETLDEFLRQFPSVRRDQAIAALDFARATLLAGARPS